MQSETSQPGSSAPEDDVPSQSNKKRRTSDRSIRSIPSHGESSSNAPSSARRTLTRSSPQRGSSREMTPPEGAESIRYTRTGRVSRANKGQRVHACEECGKIYTRAEHLRRHQQNHKPGAYPCDVPGCGRSFYREDLLVRHKARHNDPLHPVSGQPSPGSQDSAPTADMGSQLLPHSSDTHTLQSGSEPEIIQTSASQPSGRNNGQQNIGKRAHKGSPENILHRPPPVLVTIPPYGDYPNLHPVGHPWDSPPYSPTGWISPSANDLTGPPYYQSQSHRDRQTSDASYFSHYLPPHTSQSPISAGSSTVYPPYWGNNAHDAAYRHVSTDFGAYHGNITDLQLLPEYRDLMEQAELVLPMGTLEHSSLDPNLDETTFTNENKYLCGYWLWTHPFFPVVHRPSFGAHNASPLLKAAMQALGAHALGSAADKTNARIIHERCTKVLKKRTLNGWHTFRVCDLQAVILVEVYSIFKSRRPPLQFSKHFEDVFQFLATDNEALTVNHGGDGQVPGSTSIPNSFPDDFPDNTFYVLDAECKQRLLLACYVLNQQHALLFGRKRITRFPGGGEDLPFPRSQASWDSNNGQQRGSEEYVHEQMSRALASGNFHQAEHTSYDVFQSMHVMACVLEPADAGAPYPSGDLSAILPLIEQSPRVNLAYNTFLLCKHTPVRQLLAVAGESWVMSEKLGSQAEYTAAQIDSRQWARGFTDDARFAFPADHHHQSEVQRAVTYALKVLELHQTHPKTGLIFQEWAVYLASVVIWARAYVTSDDTAPRLSVPNPREPRLSSPELEQAVSAVIAAGPGSEVPLEEAKKVLLWTRGKIEKGDLPHNCGITNGALDVLGKLVSRGSEEGWFGL